MPSLVYTKAPRRAALIAAVFFLAFASQLTYWIYTDYPDKSDWVRQIDSIAHGATPDFAGVVLVHPGTSIILPTASLVRLHVSPLYALDFVMALMISASITLICAICLAMRPRSKWCFAVAFLLLVNPLYGLATAPSAVAGALVPLVVAMVFYAREQTNASSTLLALIGLSAGVLLATRVDTGTVVCIFTFAYLLYLFGVRAWIFAIVALASLVVLDPYLLLYPVPHSTNIVQLAHSNYAVTQMDNAGYTVEVLALASLSCVMAVLASLRTGLTSVPRDFLFFIATMFFVACIAIASLQYHPMRYYFPFAVAMEIFLPLLVFDSIERSVYGADPRMTRITEYAFLGMLLLVRVIPWGILVI